MKDGAAVILFEQLQEMRALRASLDRLEKLLETCARSLVEMSHPPQVSGDVVPQVIVPGPLTYVPGFPIRPEEWPTAESWTCGVDGHDHSSVGEAIDCRAAWLKAPAAPRDWAEFKLGVRPIK